MPQLLALNLLVEADPTAKIIIGLVVGAIWLIGQVATAMTKKQDNAKRRSMQEEIELERARRASAGQQMQPTLNPEIARRLPPIVLPPTPSSRKLQRVKPFRQPQPRQQQRPAQQRQAAQRPVAERPAQQQPAQRRVARPPAIAPPALPVAIAAPSSASTKPIYGSSIADQAAAKLQRPRADAGTLQRWLTPRTLNQQFMLTEILQPPVALRDQHLA
jgi:outer membrane biosynthesis protein TonB